MENRQNKRTIKPFTGERYSVWKFRVRTLLAEIGVLNVIEDEGDERDEEWKQSDLTAEGIIIEYLSDYFLGFAQESERAQEIFWKLDQLNQRRSLATQ